MVEWQHRFGRPGTAVLDRLRAARDDHGVLDSGVITAIAGQLRLPVAGSASFYADLAQAKRGRRHVQVCQGTSCFAATSGRHVRQVEDALVSKADTVHRTARSPCRECIAWVTACYTSPAVLDGELPVVGLGIAQQLSGADGAHPAVPKVPFVSASSPAVILAGLTRQEASWQAWPQVLKDGSADQVLAEATAAGLRGRGGAEYPAGAKWRAARHRDTWWPTVTRATLVRSVTGCSWSTTRTGCWRGWR
jgi:NADH-quinone oxidoreductase subunit F